MELAIAFKGMGGFPYILLHVITEHQLSTKFDACQHALEEDI